VIGKTQLPDFEDWDNLPYLEAMLKEKSLRWNPVLLLSLPHRSMSNNIHDGYLIPGGLTVVGNTWKILHDPKAYSDPFTFDPECFLPKDRKELAPNPSLYAFGFDRQ
ncbi:cytochrome P450, partial [Gymnopus androsaceus JB14]